MKETILLASAAVAAFLYGSMAVKLATMAFGLFAWWQMRRPSGIPPGPRGIPFFGYAPFLGRNPCMVLEKLAKKYGNIFSLYLGNHLAIVLYDYASAKKAFIDHGDLFSGRPTSTIGLFKKGDEKGFATADGLLWREHRRFALTTLRNSGIGKSSIEPQILDEIQHFLDAVNEENGQPFDIMKLLGASICNNICILEFGKRFEYTDERFINLKLGLDEGVKRNRDIELVQQFPFLRWMPGRRFIHGFDFVLDLLDRMEEFFKDLINEHRQNYVPGSVADYVDASITEKANREQTNNYPELFDDEALIKNLRTLFVAGTETTSTTLRWGLLFMMMHPDIQKKVQKEIDDVIGRHRAPSFEDRLNMPYTEATLMEVQRRRNAVGTNIPHSNLEAINFEGYSIPKRSMIITDLYGIHHDEKLFPDPNSFRPERFINEEGKAVRPECLVPFSLGKRFCLGEPLARMELFLYFTSMLQKFNFRKPEEDVLTTDGIFGFNVIPNSFRLIAEPRN